MRTKRYEFTNDEILVLREAITEYYHSNIKPCEKKNKDDISPIAVRMIECTKALKEQFKQDYMLIRD